MTKQEIQKRVTRKGEIIALDDFAWDEKTNTFSTGVDGLCIDFEELSCLTISCRSNNTIKCSSNNTIKCRYNNTIDCGFNNIINCASDNIIDCITSNIIDCGFNNTIDCGYDNIINSDENTVIVMRKKNLYVHTTKTYEEIQSLDYNHQGYIVDGIYTKTNKPAI